MNYMFDYTVAIKNDPKAFKETCAQIEAQFPTFGKEELLIDVDGSTIQMYSVGKKRMIVYDDYDIGAVFVKSDIELPFLR